MGGIAFTGLAEPMRYMFALAGVPYEDIRLPRDEHWPRLVPEVKARILITNIFGYL